MRSVFLLCLLVAFSCRPKVFNIPTPSMEATLPVGSKVWLTYGPVDRNDIIVFRLPTDPKTLYIFRMIAEPGDQIKISNGQVLIDRRRPRPPDSVQYRYHINTSTQIEHVQFNRLGISDYYLIQGGYAMYATPERATKLAKIEGISSVERNLADPQDKELGIYTDFEGWNKDHFGPLRIPKAGEVISGNELKRYSSLISSQEGVDISGLKNYQFKKSYCFVMGDNRDNALDSRFIGLIPMENVLGPAKLLF